jgi:hypothetical protein
VVVRMINSNVLILLASPSLAGVMAKHSVKTNLTRTKKTVAIKITSTTIPKSVAVILILNGHVETVNAFSRVRNVTEELNAQMNLMKVTEPVVSVSLNSIMTKDVVVRKISTSAKTETALAKSAIVMAKPSAKMAVMNLKKSVVSAASRPTMKASVVAILRPSSPVTTVNASKTTSSVMENLNVTTSQMKI